MSPPELDDVCKKLFSAFFIRAIRNEEPIRFNELQRHLDENGLKISRPTLILHLNHMIKKGLIKRTRVSKQHIEYSLDEERWIHLKELAEDQVRFKKFFDAEKGNFNSATPFIQVSSVLFPLVLRSLLQIKYEILKIIEPENQFDYNLMILSYSTLWDNFKSWLLKNVQENEDELIEEYLEAVNKYVDKIQKAPIL